MRSVGLDLGARHIAYTVVRDGVVIDRGSVRKLSELKDILGAESARVAFEASREGWHVHDTLKVWGHEPFMLDTTRVRQLGVGHHGRKNDAIDSETIALALDAGRVALAHILSPARRQLRAKLSIRHELVELRARQITMIRGLARAVGARIRSCATKHFLVHVEKATLDAQTRALIAPLVATLKLAEDQIVKTDAELVVLVADDPLVNICATVPGVGLIVAASYVSVLDDAKRFRNADAVASYYGLAPSEATTGGPSKRRLGGITKHGNTYARSRTIRFARGPLRSPTVVARTSPPSHSLVALRRCCGRCVATERSTTQPCLRARARAACVEPSSTTRPWKRRWRTSPPNSPLASHRYSRKCRR